MNSGVELDLPGLAVSPVDELISMGPIPGREEPVVWISELAVYRSWPPSAETLLRSIKLRRGLNILWAKPTGTTAEASRLAGHGAGKTTFCRLIRFVLGERTFGSAQFREAFRAKFGDGWVLAQVFLKGKRWLVGRPLSDSGHHPFAVEGGSLLDDFPKVPSRGGFAGYEAAMDSAVFGEFTLRTLSDSGAELDWQRLIAWLARDQEAHFSGLLDWRHKESDSKTPEMSHDDRGNLVRLVLGLVDEEGQTLLGNLAAKSQQHEQKVRDRGKMEFAVERERRKLATALVMEIAPPGDALLQREVKRVVAELRSRNHPDSAKARHDEEIHRLVSELGAREAEAGLSAAMVKEWEEAVQLEEARLAGEAPPTSKNEGTDFYRELVNGVGPFPGFCSHPINTAWRKGCPIARERTTEEDDEVELATRALRQEKESALPRLDALKDELERRRRIAEPKQRALQEGRIALDAARARHMLELDALRVPHEEAKRIDGLLRAYTTACEELETWDADLVRLKAEKDDLNFQLSRLSQQHQELVKHFGQLFDCVARKMLGDVVTGRVRFVGKAIEPELDYHGPRDSAAFKVVRWIAFDLAALALGLADSKAHHPRFLMHDSPREADLAAPIYTALFQAARELEGQAGSEPGFQYIVTTTEAPPPELNRSPWILEPVLDGSIPEQRLLGVDL